MKKKKRREVPWRDIRCVWCGVEFKAVRSHRRTCGPSCRWKLATYKNSLGWEPDAPPGNVTAAQAIKAVIDILIHREQQARALDKRADQYRAVAGIQKFTS